MKGKLLLLLGLVLLACDPGPQGVTMSAYDTACEIDEDCAVVSGHCPQGGCNCPAHALSSAALAQYRQDIADLNCVQPAEQVICRCLDIRAECREGACSSCKADEESADSIPACVAAGSS